MTLGEVVVNAVREDVAQQRDTSRCPRCGSVKLRIREIGGPRGIKVTCHCRDCGYGGVVET